MFISIGDLLARVSNPGVTDEETSILIYETCDRVVAEITKLALETRQREKMQYELNREREREAEASGYGRSPTENERLRPVGTNKENSHGSKTPQSICRHVTVENGCSWRFVCACPSGMAGR